MKKPKLKMVPGKPIEMQSMTLCDVFTSGDSDLIMAFLSQKRSEHKGKIEVNGYKGINTNFTILVTSTYYRPTK